MKDFGVCMLFFNVFLIIVGFEILGVCMERICENVFCFVKVLKENKKVILVNYSGFEESIYY